MLTEKTVDALDESVEVNPIIKSVVKVREGYLWLFKGVEIIAFGYLIYYLSTFGGNTSFYILLAYIFLYGLLVLNNSNAYFKATGKQSTTMQTLFVFMLVVSIGFIYLNSVIYEDLKVSYDSLSQCNANYTELWQTCQADNTSTTGGFNQTVGESLQNLNLGGNIQ